MAICKDCIEAGVRAPAAATVPCEGLTFTLVDAGGRTETATAVTKDNPLALIGYDILFDFGGKTFSVVYSAPNWLILDANGVKVWASSATGVNNNSCPPTSGWSDISFGAYFTSVGVDYITAPGPSGACTVSNGTFDSNSTGWTVTNGAWSGTFSGCIIFDNALLGSLSQASVLTIGETYTISLDYSTSTRTGYCTPTQLDQAYIKIYAGTKVYTHPLDDTSGAFNLLEVELTCEGNTTLKVEVFDPNQCYGTITGSKGRAIDNICAVKTTIVTDPTGEDSPLPSVEYKDIAEVPAQVNGVDYNTKLSQYQECLAVKGTTFYNKVIGGVKCDYRELSKLKLIIELLGQKNEDRALDCIYDRENIITAIYPNLPTGNLPVLVEGQTTIVVNGDLSQFETFIFHIEAVTDYAVLEGSVLINTTVSAFYIAPGGLPFLITGYTFSLLNNLGDSYATSGSNYVTNILYNQAGPPLNNTVIPFGTISTPALFTVANGTTWALYAPVTASTIPVDFTTTIVDAVYNATTNKTTIIIQDPLPGTIGAATYAVEFASENDNTYLKTFIDFANRFCADCIVTGPAPTPTTPVTPSLGLRTSGLGGETGIPLTTEFNQKIII
jgi:hypothetical protein